MDLLEALPNFNYFKIGDYIRIYKVDIEEGVVISIEGDIVSAECIRYPHKARITVDAHYKQCRKLMINKWEVTKGVINDGSNLSRHVEKLQHPHIS